MVDSSSNNKSDEKGILIKTLHTQLYPYMNQFFNYERCYDLIGCGLSIGKFIENTSNSNLQSNSRILFWSGLNEYHFIKECDIPLTPIMSINSENIISFLFYDYFLIAFNVLEVCEYNDIDNLGIQGNDLLMKVIRYVLEDNNIIISHKIDTEPFALIIDVEQGIAIRNNVTREAYKINHEIWNSQKKQMNNIFNNVYRNNINILLKNFETNDFITAHVHSENIQFYLKTYGMEDLKQKSIIMDW